MKIRKGKTKNILDSSINAALLAVEVYNKPRTTFRSQAYIVLMIIAWTRLFHAHFNKTIGNKYYFKLNNGRYDVIDGQRKAWDLKTCIDKYGRLKEPIKENLLFFIKLRNKIEHRHVSTREVDVKIFGECQSLLYNYETLLIHLFGEENALNESLVFSLQFAHMRHDPQIDANRSMLSYEVREILSYIDNYRTNLREDVFQSQEFSIKLLQIPKISNTKRGDLAVEFVRWNELDSLDKEKYQKLEILVKDKLIEGKNVGKMLPGRVVEAVNKKIDLEFKMHDHICLHTIFSVRPSKNDPVPERTNSKFCHYDDANNKYVYLESWVDFIVNLFNEHSLTIKQIRKAHAKKEKWDINEFC